MNNPFNNTSPIAAFRNEVTPSNSPTGMAYGGKIYKGPALNVKKEDPENMKPKRSLGHPQARVFNMEKESDVKAYEKIMSDVLSNKVHIGSKQMFPNRVPFCIYVEWYSDTYVAPEKIK